MASQLARLARAIARIPRLARAAPRIAAIAALGVAAPLLSRPAAAVAQASQSVTPDGGQASVQANQWVDVTFQVAFVYPYGYDYFSLQATCTGTAIGGGGCSTNPSTPPQVVVQAISPLTVTVSFLSNAIGTTGRVVLKASRTEGISTVFDTGYVDITVVPPPAPVVTPKGQAFNAVIGTSDVVTFTVKNTSSASRAYTVTTTCTGSNYTSTCVPSSSAPTIAAGDSAMIAVGYATTTTLGTGRITLKATSSADPASADSGWFDITTVHATAPVVAPDGFDAVLKSNTSANFFFRVRNPNTMWNTWNFTVSCTGAAITSTCTPNAPTAGASGGDSLDVSVQFNVGNPGTTGRVLVTMTLNNDPVVKDTAWINVTSSATAPPYPISVTPNLDSAVATTGKRGSVPFYVANTSGLTQTLKIWRSCSGTAITGNCTQDSTVATTSIMSSGPSSTFIGFLFPTGFDAGAAGSTGVIRMVAAKASNMSVRDSGLFNVKIVTAPVVVTPHGGTLQMIAQRDTFATLYVKNPNVAAGSFTITSGCSGAGITNPSGCTPSQSSVSWGTGPDSVAIRVNFHTGNPPDTATVWVVSYPPGTPSLRDSGWVKIAVQGAVVAVSPHDSSVARLPNVTSAQESFIVRNPGTLGATYTFAPICTWGGAPATPCTAAPTSANINAGGQTSVTVTYNTGAEGTTGVVWLAAAGPGGTPADTGKITVSIPSPYPVATLVEPRPGTSIARNQCLTVALPGDAASECGDLRLTHALPAVRTMNATRVPTLIYSSGLARPRPVFIMNLALGATALPLDSVEVMVVIDTDTTRTTWPGSELPPGATKRAAVAVDLIAKGLIGTRIRNYTINIATFRNGTRAQSPTQTTGKLAIVDRSDSPYGGGWWLAGLEQIFAGQSDGSVLWVGGDGSTRRFAETSVGSNTFVPADSDRVDFPDTLKKNGSSYTRYAPNGVLVRFDAGGRHVVTTNARGDSTLFAYGQSPTGVWRLTQLTVPPAVAAFTYDFAYINAKGPGFPNERLSSITAESDPRPRVVTIATRTPDGLISSIQDPGNFTVSFQYPSPDYSRIATRTDRRGVPTTFVYDSAGKVASASLDMGPGQTAIAATLRQIESVGLRVIGSASHFGDTLQSYVKLDGPRPAAVGDTTGFWLTRFGGVRKVRNALGDTTLLTRADPDYAALVTELRAPNGLISRARYTRRGNDSVMTVVDPFGDGRGDAVTKYFYRNPAWPDGVTRIEYPVDAGQTARFDSIGYDAFGRIVSREDGRAGSRTTFAYYGQTTDGVSRQLRSITYPAVAGAPAAVDSIAHGTFLGNVTKVRNAIGAWTQYDNDNAGRPFRIGRDISAGGSAPTTMASMQRTEKSYDILGRDSVVTSIGPALSGILEQRVTVQTLFDAEGNVGRVTRSGTTGGVADGIGPLVTEWVYDRANRRVKEIAPDLAADSTVYDEASNPIQVLTRRTNPGTGARLVIAMAYDTLNRMTRRVLPEVSYQERVDAHIGLAYPGVAKNVTYPRLQKDATTQGYRIAPDTQLFSYDKMGRVLRARNHDAIVTRTYFNHGLLSSETQQIRTYAGSDTTSHVYTIGYEYTMEGQRRRVTYPSGLVRTAGNPRDTVRYHYELASGLLDSIVDLQGNRYGYQHDVLNQLRVAAFPGGITQVRSYDVVGRLIADSIRNQSGSQYAWTDTVLRRFKAYYNARDLADSTRNFVGRLDSLKSSYAGLGHVVSTQYGDRAKNYLNFIVNYSSSDQLRYDALGNVLSATTLDQGGTRYAEQGHFGSRTSRYHANTGRLASMGDYTSVAGTRIDTLFYDEGGNEIFRSFARISGTPTVEERASYYDASGQLRATDHRTASTVSIATASQRPMTFAFEEYRYDALGRRVLSRAQNDCNPADSGWELCYLSYLRRTIWDGSQELLEIQMPGGASEIAATLENDTLALAKRDPINHITGTIDVNPYWGRVAYVNGTRVDEPVAVVRWDVADTSLAIGVPPTFERWREPVTIVPHWNARGMAEFGTFAEPNGGTRDGAGNYCKPVGNGVRCVPLIWPYGWTAYRQQTARPVSWHGSLIEQKRDASQLMYRRNRYYDSETGRFTQEDPIGLAGGVNLYGFAGGDPVSYSDPFGLAPMDIIVQGEYSTAVVEFLKNSSQTFREWFDKLDADHSITLTIRDATEQEMDLGSRSRFDLPSRTIIFNPRNMDQGNQDLVGRGERRFMFTGASVMGHEMAHAAGFFGLVDRTCGLDHPASNACSLRYENRIRTELPVSARGGRRLYYDQPK
jgi:RHS repeat-associated protein